MSVLLCPNPSGLLTINDTDLESECWAITSDLIPLWFIQRVYEEDGPHVPGTSGEVFVPPDIAPAVFDLKVIIIGSVDPDGDAYADPWEGIESNINLFRTEVLDPITANRGLQESTLTMPSGDTRTANVFVRPWQPGVTTEGAYQSNCSGAVFAGVHHRGILSIRVPSGVYS